MEREAGRRSTGGDSCKRSPRSASPPRAVHAAPPPARAGPRRRSATAAAAKAVSIEWWRRNYTAGTQNAETVTSDGAVKGSGRSGIRTSRSRSRVVRSDRRPTRSSTSRSCSRRPVRTSSTPPAATCSSTPPRASSRSRRSPRPRRADFNTSALHRDDVQGQGRRVSAVDRAVVRVHQPRPLQGARRHAAGGRQLDLRAVPRRGEEADLQARRRQADLRLRARQRRVRVHAHRRRPPLRHGRQEVDLQQRRGRSAASKSGSTWRRKRSCRRTS